MAATRPPTGQPPQGQPAKGQARIRLGELLVRAGVLSEGQLKTALQEQRQWGGKLGDILVRMRYLNEDVFVRALSKQLGMERADLSGPVEPRVLAQIPAEFVEEHEVIPLALEDEGRTLVVATADPMNMVVLDTLRSLSRMRVVAKVAGASQIRTAISRLYQGEDLRPDEGEDPMEILRNADDHVVSGQRIGHLAGQQQGESGPFVSENAPGFLPVSPFGAAPAQPPSPFGYGGSPTPTYPPGFTGFQGFSGGAPQGWAPAPGVISTELAALRALVELLVQKGLISQEEYLAKMRQHGVTEL